MASLERIQPVSPAGLSASLPPVRLNPDRERNQPDHEEPEEEQHDVLELHEEDVVEVAAPPVTLKLIDYEGLDLSA